MRGLYGPRPISASASAAPPRRPRAAAVPGVATTASTAVLSAAAAAVAPTSSPAPTTVFTELGGDLPNLAFRVRKYLAVFGGFLHFVRRPGLGKLFLEILERIGSHGSTLAAQNHEPNRPVQYGDLTFRERARDFLGETQSRHALPHPIALLDIIVDLDFAVANRGMTRKLRNAVAHFPWHELPAVDRE